MDWGLERRGSVRTRMTIKLDEMKLKDIYGNGDIQMIQWKTSFIKWTNQKGRIYYNITPEDKNNRVPLVITYSKGLLNIYDILRKNMKICKNQSDKMKNVFDQPPIVSFRRDKTLKIYWCTVNTTFSFIINITNVRGVERTALCKLLVGIHNIRGQRRTYVYDSSKYKL